MECKKSNKLFCRICIKEFVGKVYLERHEATHLDVTIKCDICNNQFKGDHSLNEHKKIHLERKSFACQFCEKFYFSKYHLRNHSTIHLDTQTFKCNTCEKEYKNAKTLALHSKTMHEGSKDPRKLNSFPCKMCKKSFELKCYLRRHTAIHLDVRPFSCKLCEKTFKCAPLMNSHMKNIHRDKNNKSEKNLLIKTDENITSETWFCEFCHKMFTKRQNLKLHKRIHDPKEEPSACNLCTKIFPTSVKLIQHSRRMHGDGK